MIIPGRLLVFITVLHNRSVAVAPQFKTRSLSFFILYFIPPDKDNAINALLAAFHFYLTLGGRLSLMRVDNMRAAFKDADRLVARCASALNCLPDAPGRNCPSCEASAHIRSEEQISRWRGPLPCRQRGEQMTFVSLEVSLRCILCS